MKYTSLTAEQLWGGRQGFPASSAESPTANFHIFGLSKLRRAGVRNSEDAGTSPPSTGADYREGVEFRGRLGLPSGPVASCGK